MDKLARTDRKKHRPSFRPTLAEVAGWSVVIAAIPAGFLFFPGDFLEVIGVVMSVAGAGKAVVAHFRPEEDDDDLPPPSAAFLAAADPRRPLPPAATAPAPRAGTPPSGA